MPVDKCSDFFWVITTSRFWRWDETGFAGATGPQARGAPHPHLLGAEFFRFGTTNLTATSLGLSRDDSGSFTPAYTEAEIETQARARVQQFATPGVTTRLRRTSI